MNDRRIAAVTGGTGFLGRWIVRALAGDGWRPRLLVRRDPVHPQLNGVDYEIVPGDLGDGAVLRRLVCKADLVVHAAGVVKALTRRGFFDINLEGTACLARAASEEVPGARFVLISSLAAREPQLSWYAASKAEGERIARAEGPADLVIVRPSAVYGPWDRETLPIFRAATRGVVLVPPCAEAHVCLVHAADAASAIAALSRKNASGGIYEMTDACHGGYSWKAIGRAASYAVGRKVRVVRLPASAIQIAGFLGGSVARIRRKPSMLNPGKAREILHSDWGSAIGRQPPSDLWRPSILLEDGFSQTVRWYRAAGWLP